MANRQSSVIVAVRQGFLRGRIEKLSETLGGRRFYSFRGIPYAQPPIGELRFKDPLPPKPWKGVRDAFTSGPMCIQVNPVYDGTVGEEDCLYLNVYVPEQDCLEHFQTMPVMVWIHGGGYIKGSGDSEFYGPEFFMMKGNVILVTINYRLGPLGFMSLGTKRISGNAGLKDQVFALKWIQDNILRFRGNPDNITIFGNSSGSVSVHYLTISPLAKGLFHKAICQSGLVNDPLAYIDKNIIKERTIKFAKILGCESEDPEAVADFLQQVPAITLAERYPEVIQNSNNIIDLVFGPTSEPKSLLAFLTEDPKELLKSGNFHKLPLMIGVNTHEGLRLNILLKQFEETLVKIDKDISLILSNDIKDKLDKKNPKQKQEILKKIREFYFADKAINKHSYEHLTELYSDMRTYRGTKQVLDNFVRVVPDCPLYFYLFGYDGNFGFSKILANILNKPIQNEGAAHSDEIGYLFRVKKHFPEPLNNSLDYSVILRMMDIWTDFALKGNPSDNIYINWEPYNKNKSFLKINSSLDIEDDFYSDRISFWDQIFQLLEK